MPLGSAMADLPGAELGVGALVGLVQLVLRNGAARASLFVVDPDAARGCGIGGLFWLLLCGRLLRLEFRAGLRQSEHLIGIVVDLLVPWSVLRFQFLVDFLLACG